jgi:hypothetical protein
MDGAVLVAPMITRLVGALAFKLWNDPYVGKLVFFRLYCRAASKRELAVVQSQDQEDGAHQSHHGFESGQSTGCR